ncbi:MAG: type II secretion system protein GspD [Candidatus Abyssobacteria bacterium SURF_5]|uniref:Type II secretion system protein GspD n=1 Tax=Abyssobacteria bacterium (strain SURF_5) TaxID=2093360 RepID=A0A3A4NXC8_ABYX5|nr:MAG: type II secretion system protein GspD [Candidatus Abyssubacteria bacterium SURF_5]
MGKRYLAVLTAIVVGYSALLQTGTFAQPPQAPPSPATRETNNQISINFDNASILEVIDVMSRVTGENFIIDPAVKGTVTVIAPKRVERDEAFGVFLSILEMNGFSLVRIGNIYKVVPSRTATQKSIPVHSGRESRDVSEVDKVITQLIPIKYSDAQAIVSVITPLISRDANITAYPNTNTIIITDTAANIKRLIQIIEEVDVPGFEQTITILPLMNAQADVLTQEILQALEAAPAGMAGAPGAVTAPRTRRRIPAQQVVAATASQIKIIPDLRTNSLIVVANEFDTEQVRFLVRELDKPTPIEANNIHVYRLKNALAEDVAAVLTNLAGQTAPAAPGGAPGATAVTGIRTFYKEVSIVADKTTNSLIITASPQDYAVIAAVIDELDILRPQVLVETLIAEVSLDFTRDLGIRWLVASPDDEHVTFGSVGELSNADSLGASIAGALAGDTLVLPTQPAGINIGYLNIDEDFLRAFIEANASQSNNDFNVLSAPHILTLDNQKATINVSQSVPFITQRVSDVVSAGASAVNEAFEYRDVGIILEITPHISPDRMVRLEITQEVNDAVLQEVSSSTGEALTELKREANTTVLVKDRNTLVLGGLMQDDDSVTVSKVPFLGDIPFLGWLFKSTSVQQRKMNLLIFITPSIVTSVAEAAELTLERRMQATDLLQEKLEACPTFQDGATLGESAIFTGPLEESGPK